VPVFFVFGYLNQIKTGQRLFEADKKLSKGNNYSREAAVNSLKGGILCGIFLFGGMWFQQMGIQYTTVAKSGFLTALYIVMIPIIGILIGRKLRLIVFPAVTVAILGMYFLCITDRLKLAWGDSLTLICAICYACQILSVDRVIDRANSILLSVTQFFVAAVLGCVCMFIFEKPDMGAIMQAWLPLVYSGVVSGAMGYTLQIVGQRGTDPAVASLIMSLESVFSLIAGWIILHEACSPRQLFGCALMMVAICLVQLPEKKSEVSTSS